MQKNRSEKQDNKKPNIVRDTLQFLAMLLIMMVIVRGVVGFIRIPVIVRGDSMKDSLHDGDRLYGRSIGGYKRGDVIFFDSPLPNEPGKHMIKRVIALAGDTVEIKEGIVYVNDKRLKEDYIFNHSKTELEGMSNYNLVDIQEYVAYVYGKTAHTQETVPEGQVFVLGDNRENSNDSRYYGTIEDKSILGTIYNGFKSPN